MIRGENAKYVKPPPSYYLLTFGWFSKSDEEKKTTICVLLYIHPLCSQHIIRCSRPHPPPSMFVEDNAWMAHASDEVGTWGVRLKWTNPTPTALMEKKTSKKNGRDVPSLKIDSRLEHVQKWRFASDHVPWTKWVIFRFQSLTFRDVYQARNRTTGIFKQNLPYRVFFLPDFGVIQIAHQLGSGNIDHPNRSPSRTHSLF